MRERLAHSRIVVTQAQCDVMARQFEATWDRPPAPAELRGLVDDCATDEMLFRRLRLDRGTGADDMRLTITPGGRKCKSWRTCED